ncbi:hypothetical protein [Nocardiopsis sp. CC223A]|nr:hypothetical protein [Nocardiopsis sp. CC223A]
MVVQGAGLSDETPRDPFENAECLDARSLRGLDRPETAPEPSAREP